MAKRAVTAKIRPLANASLEKATLLGAARLYVSKDSLIALTGELTNGKACTIEKVVVEGEEGQQTIKREACLYVLPGQNVSPNVVQMSRAFQEATGFKIGDQVNIEALDGPVPEAEEVLFEDVTKDPANEGKRRIPLDWEMTIAINLERAEQAFPGMVLEGVSIGRFRRSFKVISVDGRRNGLVNVNVTKTYPRLLQPGDAAALANGTELQGELILKEVPGMGEQVRQINKLLYTLRHTYYPSNLQPTTAFLIEGGRGTGKTFILEKLASTNWGRVFRIQESDKSSAIREKFKQARAQKTSIILIDDIQTIVLSEGTERRPVITALEEELGALSSSFSGQGPRPQTLVVAACRDRMKDVPEKLQAKGRLSHTIVLPIPRVPERLEILRHHASKNLREEEREPILGKLAEETYAYSCSDLEKLVDTALSIRLGKGIDEYSFGGIPTEYDFLSMEDFLQAKQEVPASLMQDIHLQPQTVKWDDIGGQEDVKNILSRMIKQTKATNTTRMLSKPGKGLLLYGPPGCSKTLSARAMATESGFNFFSIKAGELLNMYVGESERQVREVFARAKAAQPAIIFFDEIESIAKARSGGPGTTNSGGNGGVNTLTSLLTEMDGFEALSGVLIIAATNKPETIDSALMRPGRFSKVVYVGPPDLAARESIFRVHLRKQRLAPDVDLAELAAKTEGHSGSEIESIVDETTEVVQERVDDAEDDEAAAAAAVITREDLMARVEKAPKTITKEILDGFDRWGQRAGFINKSKPVSIFA